MDAVALDDYQKFTGTTAIYPEFVTPETEGAVSQPNVFYTVLGLCSEVGELLTAMELRADQEDLIKELGDILWYVSETATTAGVPLAGITWNPQPDVDEDNQPILCDPYGQGAGVAMAETAGRLAGLAKRVMRDNAWLDFQVKCVPELARMLEWMSFWAVGLGVTMQYIANVNLAKLTSRQERGVLTGEGDNR